MKPVMKGSIDRNVPSSFNSMVTTSPPILTAAVPRAVPRHGRARCGIQCRARAGVELEAKRGRMGPSRATGLVNSLQERAPAEFRVGEGTLVAVGIAEMILDRGLGNPVELALRAHPPTASRASSGEVELLQRRMPVHPDDLADAVGVDLEALPSSPTR